MSVLFAYGTLLSYSLRLSKAGSCDLCGCLLCYARRFLLSLGKAAVAAGCGRREGRRHLPCACRPETFFGDGMAWRGKHRDRLRGHRRVISTALLSPLPHFAILPFIFTDPRASCSRVAIYQNPFARLARRITRLSINALASAGITHRAGLVYLGDGAGRRENNELIMDGTIFAAGVSTWQRVYGGGQRHQQRHVVAQKISNGSMKATAYIKLSAKRQHQEKSASAIALPRAPFPSPTHPPPHTLPSPSHTCLYTIHCTLYYLHLHYYTPAACPISATCLLVLTCHCGGMWAATWRQIASGVIVASEECPARAGGNNSKKKKKKCWAARAHRASHRATSRLRTAHSFRSFQHQTSYGGTRGVIVLNAALAQHTFSRHISLSAADCHLNCCSSVHCTAPRLWPSNICAHASSSLISLCLPRVARRMGQARTLSLT